MKANDPKEWMKEYAEFLNTDSTPVPNQLNQKVIESIKTLLSPNPWIVFVKLLGIHVVIGSLSLSICHQFGMNPFRTHGSLSDWLMEMWGHNVCMLCCGVIFVSFSILAAGYLLNVEEFKTLRRTEFLQILALGFLSLAVFSLFGTQVALAIAGLWLIGAVIGGFLTTEMIWKMKTRFA